MIDNFSAAILVIFGLLRLFVRQHTRPALPFLEDVRSCILADARLPTSLLAKFLIPVVLSTFQSFRAGCALTVLLVAMWTEWVKFIYSRIFSEGNYVFASLPQIIPTIIVFQWLPVPTGRTSPGAQQIGFVLHTYCLIWDHRRFNHMGAVQSKRGCLQHSDDIPDDPRLQLLLVWLLWESWLWWVHALPSRTSKPHLSCFLQ